MSGYLTNCYIKRRPGGPEPFKGFTPYLNGYAVVPTEDYLDRDTKWPDRVTIAASLQGKPEPANPDGYICNCLLAARGGESPHLNGSEVRLDSYTIVPLEEFCR